jgi:uroporphyrin-III C-methyltransferase
MTGTVYLVGAGPGAVDLLTLRAARLLAEADIVFHDALVPAPILTLAARAEKVAVGKRCGRHLTAQRFINKRLVDAARQHRIVVRLKGGDPMLFGRAHEELSYLRAHRVRVEVVPGITAALAVAGEMSISLTRRGVARSVTLVTPRQGAGEAANEWARAVLAADTSAIYMGAGDAKAIVQALLGAGKRASTPVAIVENASLPEARTLYGSLAELPALAAQLGGGPALIVLGEVLSEVVSAAVRATSRKAQAR